jgi:hypothetical protein
MSGFFIVSKYLMFSFIKLAGLFESLKGAIQKPLANYDISEDSAPKLRARHGSKN